MTTADRQSAGRSISSTASHQSQQSRYSRLQHVRVDTVGGEAERRDAWTAVLASTGMEPVTVSLDHSQDEVSAQVLERALQRSPVPA